MWANYSFSFPFKILLKQFDHKFVAQIFTWIVGSQRKWSVWTDKKKKLES